MKELSTEQKAKSYDEIIEKANKMHNENCEACKACIEELISELKESDDEMVRQEIIDFVKSRGGFKGEWIAWLEKQSQVKENPISQHENKTCKENDDSLTSEDEDEGIRKALLDMVHNTTGGSLWVDYNLDKEDAIAWLEKQGEHANFRNKIQIGDKVTRNEDGVLINLSQLNRVAKKEEKQGEQKSVKVPKFKVGDFIQFNGMGHTRYTIKEVCGLSHYINTCNKRMDMSYTDANFELVEQKPTEISNICEFSIKTWVNIVDYVLTEHNGIGNYLIDPEVKDTAEKLQKKYKFDAASEEWDRVYRKGLDAGLNKGRAEALRKQKPVPKFKVGDVMRTLQEAADGFTDGMPVVVSIDDEDYHCTNERIAIKDQDNYEYPPMNRKQKPTEWSEEDEIIKNTTISFLDEFREKGHESAVMCIDWLKSLRPQSTWKPSDNELEVLRLAAEKDGTCLMGLYEQLKKLK